MLKLYSQCVVYCVTSSYPGAKGPTGGDEDQDEEGNKDENFSTPPKSSLAPVTDVMRTPRLSDFGLSEITLKGHLAVAEEVPRLNGVSMDGFNKSCQQIKLSNLILGRDTAVLG